MLADSFHSDCISAGGPGQVTQGPGRAGSTGCLVEPAAAAADAAAAAAAE